MKFRIAPYGDDKWKIQRKWLGLFWVDVLWLVGQDTYDRLSFSDKEHAKMWIDGTLEHTETTWRRKRVAQERAREIVPEEYPNHPREAANSTMLLMLFP